ncbi:MAG: ABC transporter ATP-binding protein [Actinomycetaceae bacterium]|nr:ABC transporter ATP-binding protein [Actinomycetaceae bacterium]
MRHLLKRLTLKQHLSLVVVAFLIVSQVWFELLIPDYMANIVVLTQTPGNHVGEIWAIGLKMLFAAVGSIASSIGSALIVERIASGFSKDLRRDLFTRVNLFSAAEINKFSTASLITRATNDISQVQSLISVSVWSLVRGPMMVILAVSKIAGKGSEWLTVTAIAVFLMAAVMGVMLRLAIPKFKVMQKLTDEISRITREHLIGLPVVHATNSQERAEAKFLEANLNLFKVMRFTGLTFSLSFPLIITILNLFSVAIFWVGAQLIDGADKAGKLVYFSDMVVFSNYAIQIFMSFIVMSSVLFVYPRASVAAGRINEVLNTEPSIKDGEATSTGKAGQPLEAGHAGATVTAPAGQPLEAGHAGATVTAPAGQQGRIEFKNVSFRFPDASEDTLSNINLSIEPGQTVGIIGATGSGKTSLVNLVARFYDVSAGQVLIDGVDVRDMKLTELYEKLGYVTQQAVLFKGTVATNVTYGLDQDIDPGEAQERVQTALEIAQVADFIEKHEKGAEMEISQGGKNVSGGQKQRLSIARAIAKDPQILIFDDSFSALDYRTDRLLRSQLKQRTQQTTTLIVAQRVGSIRDADQIIVMDNGEVVCAGTHQELMQTCEIYQEIASSQLSEAELKGE